MTDLEARKIALATVLIKELGQMIDRSIQIKSQLIELKKEISHPEANQMIDAVIRSNV